MEKENFHEIDLDVRKTTTDSGYAIYFNEMTVESHRLSQAYHEAIREVMREKNMLPYARGSQAPKAGYEALADPGEESLRNLIPEIHQRAREVMDRLNEEAEIEELLQQNNGSGPKSYTFG